MCHTRVSTRGAQHAVSSVSSAGRCRKYLGTGRKWAHLRCLIRVHVGVGQCCRAPDVESPALQAKNRARNVPLGQWRTCQGGFKMQTLTFCNAKITSTRTAVGQFKGQFNGAMEEMRQKVQNASTHPLRRHRHEHTHNSWSVQGPVQGGDGTLHAWVRFGARTHLELPQRTANSEHTSGVMERYAWVRCAGKLTTCHRHTW